MTLVTTIRPSSGGLPRRQRSARSRRARLAAWAFAQFDAARESLWPVVAFAMLHAVLWTLVLTALKASQDVHMDAAEAFGWGERFLAGYGKHPPLSGWVAGVWFTVFPARDWALHGLAMATTATSLVICYCIARRVVDVRRAWISVLMLAIYPIFNLKGFRFNVDLLQLVTLPLIVLAYLNAFEKRSAMSGVWLGLAAAAGMLTKYWAVTMIGSVGLAALLHPERMRFLASPAPWVALGAGVLGLLPHLIWLVRVDFQPLTYANSFYRVPALGQNIGISYDALMHHVGMLLPALLAGWASVAALPWRMLTRLRPPDLFAEVFRRAFFLTSASRPPVQYGQRLNVWLIQFIAIAVPPIAAAVLGKALRTDWCNPLYFMVPLCVVAIPRISVPRIALLRLTAFWLAEIVVLLTLSNWLARRSIASAGSTEGIYLPRSELAAQLTQEWHKRFGTRWAVVAGDTDIAAPMTFYSPDHPAVAAPDAAWASPMTSSQSIVRNGFIGLCDPLNPRLQGCEAWMRANAPNGEMFMLTLQRTWRGIKGPVGRWHVTIQPPAR